MVMTMVTVMVLRRGKRRRGNHHDQQGSEQKFPHACILASVSLPPPTTFVEEPTAPHQGSEQGTMTSGIVVSGE